MAIFEQLQSPQFWKDITENLLKVGLQALLVSVLIPIVLSIWERRRWRNARLASVKPLAFILAEIKRLMEEYPDRVKKGVSPGQVQLALSEGIRLAHRENLEYLQFYSNSFTPDMMIASERIVSAASRLTAIFAMWGSLRSASEQLRDDFLKGKDGVPGMSEAVATYREATSSLEKLARGFRIPASAELGSTTLTGGWWAASYLSPEAFDQKLSEVWRLPPSNAEPNAAPDPALKAGPGR